MQILSIGQELKKLQILILEVFVIYLLVPLCIYMCMHDDWF